MRGQAVLLMGFLVVVAALVVLVMYFSMSSAPLVAGLNPAYGYISKAWPDAVRLVEGYTAYQASSAAYSLARGALDVGGYAYHLNPAMAARWLHYNATRSWIDAVSQFLAATLAPLGVGARAGASFYVWGFNGTLGPYPLATNYGRWNLEPVRGFYGVDISSSVRVYIRLTPHPSLKAARLVVVSPVSVPGDYVVTYMGSTDQPATVGMGYNDILGDLLGMQQPWGRMAMVALDVDTLTTQLKAQLQGGCTEDGVRLAVAAALRPLYWAPEIYTCPFCMLHVKVPEGFLQQGKASEVLLLYPKDRGDVVRTGLFTVEALCPSGTIVTTYDPFGGSLSQYTDGDGDAVAAFKRVFPIYYSPDDIVNSLGNAWRSQAVYEQCWWETTGTVTGSVQTVNMAPQSVFSRALWVSAIYDYGPGRVPPHDRDFHVYTELTWSRPDVGYKVETLMYPNREGMVALYHSGSDPGQVGFMCAKTYQIDGRSDGWLWSQWQWPAGGILRARMWDIGGAVPGQPSDVASQLWYLASIGVARSGVAQWQVYSYGPVVSQGPPSGPRLLGQSMRPSPFLDSVYVVLGSGVGDEDYPSYPKVMDTYYVYLRVRPWVYPEPAVALAPLDRPPVARPVRPEILASESGYVSLSLYSNLDISAALVRSLNLTVPRVVGARVVGYIQRGVDVGNHMVRYILLVNVTHSEYRAALAARFDVYALVGNVPRTYPASAGLYSYGDRWAVYNVSFIVPSRSSFALRINVTGATVALSPGKPDLRYLQVDTNQYFIANYGNATGVLVFPWDEVAAFDDGWNPDVRGFAGYFGAMYDVTDGNNKWHVVVVPPGGLVNLTLTKSVNLATRVVPWQSIKPMSGVSQQSLKCVYRRLYVPTNISTTYYVFYVALPSLPQPLDQRDPIVVKVYSYSSNGFIDVPTYVDTPGGFHIWFKVDLAQLGLGRYQLDYSGLPIAICTGQGGAGNRNSVLNNVFNNGTSYWGSASGSAGIPARMPSGGGKFVDGYTVWVFPTDNTNPDQVSVGLNNGTNFPGQPYNCQYGWGVVAIYYMNYGGFYPPYWWQYDGYCFNQGAWEQMGSYPGSNYLFSISVSPQVVLYRIWNRALTALWVRGHPNSPNVPGFVSGAYSRVSNYQYVLAYRPDPNNPSKMNPVGFEWRITPFAWPEPYVR